MGNTLTVRLPKSLHEGIKQLSKTEGISINQFLVTAASEKMSALLTKSYLEKEALKGKKEDFDRVLRAVPDVEPDEFDKI
jgi:uncharacterized protein (DUF1778 family)